MSLRNSQKGETGEQRKILTKSDELITQRRMYSILNHLVNNSMYGLGPARSQPMTSIGKYNNKIKILYNKIKRAFIFTLTIPNFL